MLCFCTLTFDIEEMIIQKENDQFFNMLELTYIVNDPIFVRVVLPTSAATSNPLISVVCDREQSLGCDPRNTSTFCYFGCVFIPVWNSIYTA